ncbi:MAG: tRNA 4-thiouridine(8) synthase ThiI [Desulfobacteraceae bacterium]|uniref:tRNA 4-thiouridine(8) synthase ThiI n=1 Tax=Candidatus Desulfaltia bathyphila TaxID=2841697 RepID=A0A8J6N642_9BACT|nr:tRNA 4-thiouridine(8) synthase ThiI [Candidatus Desulfaltia bathyphila]MBL7195909.1 tRNA 4-thiouridine(8) synthase ThiI [Desulfobacterales bacterium]
MILHPRKVWALGLCSGGLDSILSALILRKQGIEVEWVTFETPFFSSERALHAAQITGIPITVKNITRIYLEMLKNPPCGYGKHMNPCMDCHALMFRLAGAIMKERGFDFLFSGEVVGQRPMSQTKPSLRYVEKQSGFDGFILRPLSAAKLPITIPERKGLVDRDLLLDISGRSRKMQIKIAGEFGIADYPSAAGGCLLTDKGYAARLRDLFDHADFAIVATTAEQEEFTEEELHLLKHGRHLRLNKNTKMIVGRTKSDNEQIKRYYNPDADTVIKVNNFPGPTVVVPHGGSKEIIVFAASICTGYSKAPNNVQVDVRVVTPQSSQILNVSGIPPEEIKHYLI